MSPAALPERLARGERIGEAVALVVAHPDDEALGLGSRLSRFDRLTLIHLTDGAPADGGDARRAGFATREAYAAARAAELDAALEVLDARPVRRIGFGLVDQTVVEHLADVAARLVSELKGRAAVITHAYEGGHPDHDAAALAVARARAALGPAAPDAYEFAGYFGVDGALRGSVFHPDPAAPETGWALTPAERALKARAFAAHASQRDILANFAPDREALRPAPAYDFSRPPPPGEAHYDRYGWPLRSPAWRTRAAALLREPA